MQPGLREQLVQMAGVMVLGSVIGVLYDISCCLCLRKRGLLRRLLDIGFCLLSTVLVLLYLLIHTQGELRGYLLLGGVLGFCAQRTCLHPILYRVLLSIGKRIGYGARKVADFLRWIFSFPRNRDCL